MRILVDALSRTDSERALASCLASLILISLKTLSAFNEKDPGRANSPARILAHNSCILLLLIFSAKRIKLLNQSASARSATSFLEL